VVDDDALLVCEGTGERLREAPVSWHCPWLRKLPVTGISFYPY